MIDMHAHILPDIDDGATSFQEAIEMVEYQYAHGITKVVCTPHFDASKTILSDFLKKRTESKKKLEIHRTCLIMASECMLNEFLLCLPEVAPLCIENTNYLLIEIPYKNYWNATSYNQLQRLIDRYGIIPIVAHADRYIRKFRGIGHIKKLKKMGCIIQWNATSIMCKKRRYISLNYIKRGYIDVIGSDCHNMKERPPILHEAYKIITNRLGENQSQKLDQNVVNMIQGLDIRQDSLIIKEISTPKKIEDKQRKIKKNPIQMNHNMILERDIVQFDSEKIVRGIEGKSVLVTGGGGSIGAELCKRIASFRPLELIIIENYENNAYNIQQELLDAQGSGLTIHVEIASIQDKRKMDVLFKRYRPEIVFHTAAYKHIPFMETCSDEVVKNNIFGTYNLIQVADKYRVQKFIFLSSNKAENPTSIMGFSKKICELMIQSMKGITQTKYVAIRVGNILGSNGSVVQLFRQQIEKGGPVTITDKKVKRHFMTISEVTELILIIEAMDLRSTIYVLDRGNVVSILELAERYIRLMGYEPYVDIPIVEIGMRPGEKIEEELLHEEKLFQTENNRIFWKNDIEIAPEEVRETIKLLQKLIMENRTEDLNQCLKDIASKYKD
ncbi:CpsB/CapC family capsule biosynthesis tyrosine phosphatase [Lachnospiraceae bacterium LCP25S3_G4]